jgi:glutamine phosphoribosylpyrophosphate amidotransferase
VSAYDTSHKHKEVSGRIRTTKLSNEYPNSSDNKHILVIDGTILGNAPESIVKMMYQAGWDEIYYADELDEMASDIAIYLG